MKQLQEKMDDDLPGSCANIQEDLSFLTEAAAPREAVPTVVNTPVAELKKCAENLRATTRKLISVIRKDK